MSNTGLNLRLFDVISHFLPNLFVTGIIILDYLHLVSENPRPLPFLEKKKLLGGDIHSHPHLKPLYSQSFLQSTSMTLIIINPLHSQVAHIRSFDCILYSA